MYTPTQNDPVDQDRKKVAKAIRSAIRLHYSMEADDHINRVLKPTLDAHARAVANGEEFELDLSELLSR